jgi:hypothetical protein
MPRFVRELMEFVGLGEAEAELIRRTAPAILARETEITSALYDHFLRFPATARFFLGDDGTPDLARIERRKHSLGRWLRETAAVASSHEFSYYLLAVAIAHSHRDHGPGGAIPAHFMVAAMSLTQTALAGVLDAALADRAEAMAAAVAWNKLLLVHLNVLLLGYVGPSSRR